MDKTKLRDLVLNKKYIKESMETLDDFIKTINWDENNFEVIDKIPNFKSLYFTRDKGWTLEWYDPDNELQYISFPNKSEVRQYLVNWYGRTKSFIVDNTGKRAVIEFCGIEGKKIKDLYDSGKLNDYLLRLYLKDQDKFFQYLKDKGIEV